MISHITFSAVGYRIKFLNSNTPNVIALWMVFISFSLLIFCFKRKRTEIADKLMSTVYYFSLKTLFISEKKKNHICLSSFLFLSIKRGKNCNSFNEKSFLIGNKTTNFIHYNRNKRSLAETYGSTSICLFLAHIWNVSVAPNKAHTTYVWVSKWRPYHRCCSLFVMKVDSSIVFRSNVNEI